MVTIDTKPKVVHKILVVEDELIVGKDIESQLIRGGYEVTEVVDSVPKALSSMRERRPDLVLMDIYLRGEQSGIDAAHIARDDFGVPVVFLTAYSDKGLLEDARKAQPFGYVLKPFQEPALLAAIEIAIFKHATEHKLAESRAKLVQEKELLSATLRSVDDGVITTDAHWSVQLLNPVGERITGLQQRSCLGRQLEEVLPAVSEDDGTPIMGALIERVAAGGSVHDQPGILKAADGTQRVVSISTVPLTDDNNQTQGCVVAFRDVTRQRLAEREILKAERLEALGILAGGIAHDFNNLLTTVVGGVSLAKSLLPRTGEAAAVLTSVESVLPTATDLAGQLLTFAKGDEPTTAPVLLGPVVRELTALTLGGLSVDVELELSANSWPAAVDLNQIRRVISNLLLNASQAIQEGGVIRVGVRNFDLTTANEELAEGHYVLISVEDDGAGIAPGTIARLFDPYFSTKNDGQGLGLAVAYSIVKRHGGTIRVESTLGAGTSFLVYLRATDDQPVATLADKQQTALRTGRVLVMDDEKDVQLITERLLLHLGFSVVLTSGGQEAIAVYKESLASGSPFDVAILDLTMPGEPGGAAVMQQLRGIDPEVRAIVTSGYCDDPVLTDYKDHGFRAVLEKPFNLSDLQDALHTMQASAGQADA